MSPTDTTSTPASIAADKHALIASGAVDVANLLTTHAPPETAPVCALDITINHRTEAPVVAAQLASVTPALDAVLSWHTALGEAPRLTVTRYTTPCAFTSLAAHETLASDAYVYFWTHLDADENAALWETIGHTPEVGETAIVSAETIHAAAAEVVRDQDGAA